MVSTDDGGRSLLVPPVDGGMLELEATREIELRIFPAFKAPRIRLFDSNDRILESDDTDVATDGGDDGTTLGYRISLLDGLEPGRAYHLGIDTEIEPPLVDFAGKPIVDRTGRPMDELRIELNVVGEPKSKAPASRPERSRPQKKNRR